MNNERNNSLKQAIKRISIDSMVFANCKNSVNFVIENKNKTKAISLLKSVITELENYGE